MHYGVSGALISEPDIEIDYFMDECLSKTVSFIDTSKNGKWLTLGTEFLGVRKFNINN
jgi:hypothetical protein